MRYLVPPKFNVIEKYNKISETLSMFCHVTKSICVVGPLSTGKAVGSIFHGPIILIWDCNFV